MCSLYQISFQPAANELPVQQDVACGEAKVMGFFPAHYKYQQGLLYKIHI